MISNSSLPRLLAVASVSILLVGCASMEGLSLAKSDFGVEELAKESKDQPGSEDHAADAKSSELLLVGTVSAFRKFNEDKVERFYEQYAAFAERIHPGKEPTYTEPDFRERIAGWTKLKTLSIPLVVGMYDYA